MNEQLITDLLAAYRACPADADQLRRQRIVLADALEEAGDERDEMMRENPQDEMMARQLTCLDQLMVTSNGNLKVIENPARLHGDAATLAMPHRQEEVARVRILHMFPGSIRWPNPLISLYSVWKSMKEIRSDAQWGHFERLQREVKELDMRIEARRP